MSLLEVLIPSRVIRPSGARRVRLGVTPKRERQKNEPGLTRSEARKADRRRWREKNMEAARKKWRRYWMRNKAALMAKRAAYFKKWWAENKDRINAAKRVAYDRA